MFFISSVSVNQQNALLQQELQRFYIDETHPPTLNNLHGIGRLKINFTTKPHLQLCDDDTDYFVFVPSAPKNRKKRSVVRQTWARFVGENRLMPNVRYAFVIGEVEDEKLDQSIQQEAYLFGDLLRYLHRSWSYTLIRDTINIFYHTKFETSSDLLRNTILRGET
jgi:hypothetical protein